MCFYYELISKKREVAPLQLFFRTDYLYHLLKTFISFFSTHFEDKTKITKFSLKIYILLSLLFHEESSPPCTVLW